MLDIHPQPQHAQVEVRIGEHSIDVGRLDESKIISDIHTARKILASIIADGLFVNEKETEFEFLYYFDSVDEWTSYLLAHNWGDVVSDTPLIENTRNLLPQGEGRILMRELVRAARLRRIG